MQSVYSFLSSIFPCPQNGPDSLVGGCQIFTLTIALVFFLERKYRKLVKGEPKVGDPNLPYKRVIIWENVFVFGAVQFYGLYGLYLVCSGQAKWQSGAEALLLHILCGLSIPAGVHRLYSHHAFKASKVYEIGVVIVNTILLQNPIIHWVRDHRCHHKYVDTDADPYSANRGFFYSHCGWLLVERHPLVVAKGRKLDMSDLTSNPLLKFQQDYYLAMVLVINLFLPVAIPQLLWGETFWRSVFVCWNLPWVVTLHATWSINSFSHWKGTKPYNGNMSPVDLPKWCGLLLEGEQDHNFHHAFPTDYYGSEFSSILCLSGNFIKLCSWVGLTYDLKLASPALIARVKNNNNSMGAGEGKY